MNFRLIAAGSRGKCRGTAADVSAGRLGRCAAVCLDPFPI